LGTTAFARSVLLLAPAIICLLAPVQASAEQQKLTLPQAVEMSLRNNGDLRSFREEKGIRGAGKIRAGLLPNPTLEFEAGTGALTGSSSENNISFGVSQEFLLAGKREKRQAVADRELEVFRWQVVDRERVLGSEVKRAFHDVVLARERISLADRFVELNRQLLDVARERLANGDIPELELNLVKVELARSEGTSIDAVKALTESRARLWNLMGTSGGETPDMTGNLDAELTMTKALIDLKQLAQGNRPDLKVLETEKNRGEADIILARAEGVPNLTAGLALKRDTTSMEIGGVSGKDTAYTIGVKLSVPIPVHDKNRAGIQEALARKNGIESRLQAARRNIELEVEAAHAGYLNSEKIVSLYKTAIIPQLEENLRLTQEAWRLGEAGILAVIQEQKKFFEVSDSYLAALHCRQTALVRLESAAATDLGGGEK
jgi:cobalt-zinc-cadmium efflux system outer membrane protein